MPAFYDLIRGYWAPDYPETTGYLVPTLIQAASYCLDPDLRAIALRMADYLLTAQTADGAIPGWGHGAPVYVFDTGQVIFAWLAAWDITHDERFKQATLRAGKWLVSHQSHDGYWQEFQFGGHRKVWDARVAWPLIKAGMAFQEPSFVAAGARFLNWALTQQGADGWLTSCSLDNLASPITHTIAYTIEGFLEAGILTNSEAWIEAAQRSADALMLRQRANGGVAGSWNQGWKQEGGSVCLTGLAQLACCWMRFYALTADSKYRDAAEKALSFVTSTQVPAARLAAVRGGVAGSWPLWGRYLGWKYPNWPIKFLLDGLLIWQRRAAPDDTIGSEPG